ncbi:MAG: glycosyltransferase [Nitrososphaerota archaeon]|nr:glycosyltransferase [Nitrososphaerota archaeon]
MALDFSSILLVLSLAITIVFFAYGFNIYYMLKLSRHYHSPRISPFKSRPTIAIHLPIFNEKYVISRLLEACTGTASQYGKDLVHICVLDDSDDETTEEVRAETERYVKLGYRMEVIHRDDRSGYKAGALNLALSRTTEDFIVIFDSDFLPRPDFLDRAVSYILTDNNLGVVQFKWSYTNRKYNWITKSVSVGMDAHFLIEQPARSSSGLFLNFNGSGGIIRTSALRESGGWQSDTLAEDLDASYRMQLNHYRIQYVLDEVLCEVTPTVASFKRQQGRWARGSLQVAKKTVRKLVTAREVRIKQKLAGSIHLTYYLVHPLMYFSFILATIAAIYNINSIKITLPSMKEISVVGQLGSNGLSISWVEPLWVLFGASIVLCTVAAWVYYIVAMRRQRMKVLKNVPSLLALGLLGYGICISNTVEAMKAFFLKDSGAFRRTPKYAIMESDGTWRDKKYQVPIDFTSFVEAFSIFFAASGIMMAIHFRNWGLIFILGLYCAAFTFVFLTTLVQSGEEKKTIQLEEINQATFPLVESRIVGTETKIPPLTSETQLHSTSS